MSYPAQFNTAGRIHTVKEAVEFPFSGKENNCELFSLHVRLVRCVTGHSIQQLVSYWQRDVDACSATEAVYQNEKDFSEPVRQDVCLYPWSFEGVDERSVLVRANDAYQIFTDKQSQHAQDER